MTLIDDARAERQEPTVRRPSRVPADSRRRMVRAAAWLLGTLAWSFGCVYVLNTSTFVGRPASAYISTDHEFLAGLAVDGKLAGTLVVWVVLVLLWALSGRTWVALALTLDLSLLLGAVNVSKLQVRAEPVSPADLDFLGNVGFLVDMVPASRLLVGAAVMVVVAGVIWWMASRVAPGPAAQGRRGRRLLGRLLVAVVCVALLVSAKGFNEPGNLWRAAFDAEVTRWSHWSQHENFMKNGFVAGVLYDMPVEPMTAPPGYSRQRMEEIAATYAAAAGTRNAGLDPAALDDLNVVLVLSESFSDPTRLDGFSMPVDPLPATREVMDQTTSGTLLVGNYGGGTANVEFELLTGMSLGFLARQLSIPYQQLLPTPDTFPSLVRWFADHGHDTLALHPFSGGMYRRSEVYPKLGFDQFVDQSSLDDANRDHTGTFVNDADAYDEVLSRLGDHDRPVFTHLVTMQNHYPYNGEYADPLPVEGAPSEDEARLIGQYARGLAHSDAALDRFLDGLRDLREPTAVVFYGDHLPGIYSGEVMRRNGERTMRETPFFVWRNDAANRAVSEPEVTANQLLPLMFDVLQAPAPAYVALLDAVRAELPAIQRDRFLLPDGSAVVDEQELSPAARQVLEDYRLVQYDLAVGKRWSEATLFGDAP